MLSRILVVACFVLVVFGTVSGAVPSSITAQGKLTDASGNPLAPGSKSFSFRIFDAPSLGTQLWPAGGVGEVQNLTTDAAGLWIGLIGAVSPLNDAVFADSVCWLEVTVSGTTLPRVRLVTGPYAFRVATVDGASGGTITSKVSIGPGHTNTGAHAFVVGDSNTAEGDYSAVGGGHHNTATREGAVVGGGGHNHAYGYYSTVSGGGSNYQGDSNSATGSFATIGGGIRNIASGFESAIGGGTGNRASANATTVGGGQSNAAIVGSSTVAGGSFNVANGAFATVGGGGVDSANGYYATVGGGTFNSANGSSATVSGGSYNIAGDSGAAIAGGLMNRARGRYSFVGGGGGANFGDSNSALGNHSTIGGGLNNIASGHYSSIPGGLSNSAEGNYSFAAGRNAYAAHAGTFVWADSSGLGLSSTGPNQFLIRAEGGVGIGTNSPTAQLDVNGSVAIGSGTPIRKVLSSSAALNFPNTASLSSSELTLTVTGAADGDMVALGVPSGAMSAGAIYTAWVSTANTVTIRFSNLSGGAVNPASGTFRAAIVQF